MELDINIQTIEDILPLSVFEEFSNSIFDDDYMPWYFVPSTAYQEGVISTNHLSSSFYHNIIKDGKQQSYLGDITEKSFFYIADKLNLKVADFIRARLGLIMPSENKIIHDPHVDYYFNHYTGLLYFTDEDEGETIFYNKEYEPGTFIPTIRTEHDIPVHKKVYPKKNRFVLFDGLIYHSSTTPKNMRRVALNFNFTLENI